MLKTALTLLLCCSLTSSWAVAQRVYTQFGHGCGPNIGLSCPDNNGRGGTETFGRNDNQFAFRVRTQGALLITGFELMTRSTVNATVTLTTYLYLVDSKTKNAAPAQTPVRTGKMVVGTKFDWYSTTLDKPLQLKPNETFFLSYAGEDKILHPIVEGQGTYPGVHYWRAPKQAAWNGPFEVATWAWRVLCKGSAIVPVISEGNSRTQIGGQLDFWVNYANSTASTLGILLVGSSKTRWGALQLPLDLSQVVGPGCSLLVSADLWTTALLRGSYSYNWTPKLMIPNDPKLIGLHVYNQWVIVDQTANAAGLAFSAAGDYQIIR